MIIGIGTDIVGIERVSHVVDRFGRRFINRIYTLAEQEEVKSKKQQHRFYAMRFAAKEAGWKALSPQRHRSIGWHDFEITSTDQGRPVLALHGAAREVFEEKGGGQINLSLSDDGGFALAFVVLSAP
jgi:holo-[acyl-carrier protein] synthase